MCASPLRLLRAGPPPPKVALLPDAMFFTRSVPVAKSASAQDVASQVELALETISPFPVAQLFYGWYWVPGAENALIFAAYRRRFTAEQTAAWEGAELVLPAFVAALGAKFDPGTTALLNTPEGVTALHWDDSPVPTKVISRPFTADASDDVRAKARDELLRDIGGSRKVVDFDVPFAADGSSSDRELTFRSGTAVSRFGRAAAASLDVRDKTELASLRSARQRDVMLWRVTLGCAALLLILVIGEFALMGGRAWQNVRERQYKAQKPLVDKIASVHELTSRIEDLRTKRLLPLEMVTQVVGENNERMPGEIQFMRVHAEQARGLYTLFIEGKTENPAQVNAYEATLRNLPSVQNAEAKFSQAGGRGATFSLTVTFKPGALHPTGAAVVSSQ